VKHNQLGLNYVVRFNGRNYPDGTWGEWLLSGAEILEMADAKPVLDGKTPSLKMCLASIRLQNDWKWIEARYEVQTNYEDGYRVTEQTSVWVEYLRWEL
jgi:hypothetical protein